MIGSHRDTWSYGALDATSGTSILLEVSNAMALMKQNGKLKIIQLKILFDYF